MQKYKNLVNREKQEMKKKKLCLDANKENLLETNERL